MGVVVGSIGIPGATGNFSVSGLAFQPVAVILFNQFDHLATHNWTLGAATGASEQWSMWTGTDTEISGYTRRKREGRTDACVFHRNVVTDAIQWQVSFVSFNASGFTLNLDVRNAVGGAEGSNIYYMALGGDHIPEAHAGTFTAGGSTGTTAITAPGFLPTSLICAHTAEPAWDAGIRSEMVAAVGVTDGTSSYSSFCWGIAGVQLGCNHVHRLDAIACSYNNADGNLFVMELASFDANGFTADVTDAWVADLEFGYLAINAEGAVAGSGDQPAADGDITYSTPGLLPGGVFFCWPGVDSPQTSGSNTPPMRPGVGALTDTAERHSSGIFRSSAPFGVWTSDAYQIPDEALGFWGVGDGIVGNSNLSQASTSLSSFADEEFTLTWDVTAPDADRWFGWLALPGELSIKWIPQIYRLVMPT